MGTIAKKSQCNESVMIGEIEETKASERKIQKWRWEKDIKFFLEAAHLILIQRMVLRRSESTV